MPQPTIEALLILGGLVDQPRPAMPAGDWAAPLPRSQRTDWYADFFQIIADVFHGIEFWQLKVPPELVPALAREFDWNRMGRRFMIDAEEGIISWMSPSSTHEILGKATDLMVRMAGAMMNRHVREKGGLEPDEAFYLGDKAAAWYEADRIGGEDAVHDFEARTPPNLVVEVTHHDVDKPHRYAELGIPEMWRVDGKKGIKHL